MKCSKESLVLMHLSLVLMGENGDEDEDEALEEKRSEGAFEIVDLKVVMWEATHRNLHQLAWTGERTGFRFTSLDLDFDVYGSERADTQICSRQR